MESGALDDQGRRLALSAELTRRAIRLAGARLPRDVDAARLRALAAELAATAAPVARAHRLRFEPAFPGASPGVEETAGGARLVLACRALAPDGAVAAVVFTTLIAGRPPQVAAAPAEAPIPAGWVEWRRLVASEFH